MIIIEKIIERPILVMLLAVCVAVLCAAAVVKLPVKEVPELDIPYIWIETDFPGATPAQVESGITIPLEKHIGELKGVTVLKSTSVRGRSFVGIEFASGTDTNLKLREINDTLDDITHKLPEDAGTPKAQAFSLTRRPVLFVFVHGGLDLYQLGRSAENLRNKLESVQGCSSVEIYGNLRRQVHVQLAPERLNRYLLSVGEVYFALRQQKVEDYQDPSKIKSGRHNGHFRNMKEISAFVVGSHQGEAIRVADVATVAKGLEDIRERFRVNGNDSVMLAVYIDEKADLVDTVHRVNEKLKGSVKSLPAGTMMETAGNTGRLTGKMTDQLKLNALIGGVLVILVLIIGMGFKNSLMIGPAIPFSILIACGVLFALDMSFTGVAIFSLILSLGLVVDGAIIVGENIYRHIEEGLPPQKAAKVSLQEVGGAVICANMTTVIAFLPMMFMSGPIGQYVSVIPKVVIAAVVGSLFVDHIVLPAVAAKFMRKQARKNHINKIKLSAPHLRILTKALRYRRITLGIAMLALMASLLLIPVIGTELFPKTDTSRIWVTIEMPAGTSIERTDAVSRYVEERLEEIPDIKTFASSVGMKGILDTTFGTQTVRGENFLEFLVEPNEEDQRKRSLGMILSEMREKLSEISEAKIDFKQRVEGPPAGADIAVRIRGHDLDVLKSLSTDIAEKLAQIEGAADIQTDQEDSLPQIQVKIHRAGAALIGTSPEIVWATLAASLVGVIPATLQDHGEELDVRIQLASLGGKNINDIRALRIPTQLGAHVPLTEVAEVWEAKGPAHISRRDQERLATVRCNADGRLASKILKDLESDMTNITLPPGYSIEYGGENEQQAKSFRDLGKAMALAAALVFIVLIIQCRCLIQPLVILMTIPLSFIGVILGMVVTHNSFGMMAFIGLVCLLGIVVNNAIVLVTYINILRRRGMKREAAIVRATQTRLRPILMTTITTIAGVLSTTLGLGGGVDFWAPLGWAVIWGLLTATVLTLVVVPVAYSLMEGTKDRIINWLWGNGEGALNKG